MSSARDTRARELSEAAIWQRVEFGSYEADLPLWQELAEAANGPVLELGGGGGRVAMDLAGRGHEVIAVDSDDSLVRELQESAERLRLPLQAIAADLATPAALRVPSRPTLAIGPLHVIQMLNGAARPALLGRLRDLFAPGGTIALTVVDESTLLSAGAAATQILPDMRELDGWVYSSEPLWVQVGDRALTVRRVRERVSPEGQMERTIHDEVLNRVSADRLRLEAEDAGLAFRETRQISSGPNEADSTVVLLAAPE